MQPLILAKTDLRRVLLDLDAGRQSDKLRLRVADVQDRHQEAVRHQVANVPVISTILEKNRLE